MILKTDCIHFPGDRPCVYNKRDGEVCDTCPHYRVPSAQILVVKLDAPGDVLRTTCILHGLHANHPGCEVTWVTRTASLELFGQNPLVHRVLAYETTEAVLRCTTVQYDLVVNLDTSWESCVLASSAQGTRKVGFGLDAHGNVAAFNPEAVEWLEMGAFDQQKKANTRSYQEIMLGICGFPGADREIVLHLSPAEWEFAARFADRLPHGTGLKVGLNTGASPRWELKSWTADGWEGLIRTILERTNWTVLLYGGPHEVERNRRLAAIDPVRVVDTGTGNTLRQFFALVTLSDVFVTGDTLALHAAAALKKKVVAYFGPTSKAEIDPYDGRVTKISSDLDCLCCYKPRCDFQPNCMNAMTAEYVFRQVETAASELVTKELQ